MFGAILFAVVAFAAGGAVGWIAGGVAAVLLVTALVGTCPLYLALGRSTVMRGRRRR